MKWDALVITREMNAAMHAGHRACVREYIYTRDTLGCWSDASFFTLPQESIVIIGLLETDYQNRRRSNFGFNTREIDGSLICA